MKDKDFGQIVSYCGIYVFFALKGNTPCDPTQFDTHGRLCSKMDCHRKNNPVMTPVSGISEWIDSQSLSEIQSRDTVRYSLDAKPEHSCHRQS